jgi:hypothetical protein
MEFDDECSANQLCLAARGFVDVDNTSFGEDYAESFHRQYKATYQRLAQVYQSQSSVYRVRVTVSALSTPPNTEENIGVFQHMASVMIGFVRTKIDQQRVEPGLGDAARVATDMAWQAPVIQ